MVYKYSYRATKYAVPAQQAGEYMQELRKKNGELNKFILLDESRGENALLHNCFEWDDTKAAESYRLDQAQHFISNIVCVLVDDEKNEKQDKPIRAFVNVADQSHSEKGSFVPVMEALSEEKHRQIVLKNALNELQALRDKYSQLNELVKVFSAIDEVVKENKPLPKVV